MRLTTPRHERFSQARSFNVIYGGTECNVAVALSGYGADTYLVTRLPENEIGQACVDYIRQYGVDTTNVLRGGRRLGLYFLEIGASMRSSRVVYDRAGSAMSQIAPGMVDWADVLDGKDWFHFSGITCAISEDAAATVGEACRAAHDLGVKVSMDFNYRATLWSVEEAAETLEPLLGYVDFAVGSARDPILGKLTGVDGNIPPGNRTPDAYRPLVDAAVSKYGFEQMALTVRDIHSSDHNSWMGAYFDGEDIAVSRQHEISIVDRVGGGDGFTAGVLWGAMQGWDRQKTVEYGAAAGALAHTIHGDFCLATEEEVLSVGGGSGDVRR